MIMGTKKIIPCLDTKDGRVVKGIQFVDLRDAGDPVEFAKYYEEEGADELVVLDISATVEGRKTMVEVVKKVASEISIPLIVGGGIQTIQDMERIFQAGAAKVSVNSAAVKNPELIKEAAERFGSSSIIVAIDAKYVNEEKTWKVVTHGGQKVTDLDVIPWAKQVEKLGAGEILLTSMDRDGEKTGYDIPLTKAVSEAVSIPVVASGGAGKLEDIYEALTEGKAEAALAASIFHFKETSIRKVKAYLKDRGVNVQ